jgi:HSP20 family protein
MGRQAVLQRDDTEDLFDRFFNRNLVGTNELFNEPGRFPSIDIKEDKKSITVQAEIPGMDAKEIDVSLDGRRLAIKGEKKQEKEEKEENYHLVERSYGQFRRAIELPADVDPSKVVATYKKGVLKIELKKIKEAKSKKIEIN